MKVKVLIGESVFLLPLVDSELIMKSDEDYHLRTSALEKIQHLGLVTQIPLDYFHLICLGVM